MGLFDWFRTPASNVEVLNDVIWLTKQARFNGIRKALSCSLDDPDRSAAILLVAHFQETFDEIQKIVESGEFTGPVTATIAENLSSNAASRLTLDESYTIQILVAERHPLPAHDETVVEFARSLPCRCRLVRHVSLEDPLMRCFAGEWIENLLKTLGMKEEEAIESVMVARRILAAQKKIASVSVDDLPAGSAAEWMERNCPELWRREPR